jgi:hypothetical protein
MPSKSKNKGSGYEREVAKFLSELYQESFIRVPHSGAFIGGRNQIRRQFLDENQTKSFKGDIVPPDDWNKFNCECKNYQDFPFHQLLKGNIRHLDSWIEQCLTVADPGDFNILFMKFNHKGTFVAFQQIWQSHFQITNHTIYHNHQSGIWIITDCDSFFAQNHQSVKNISCQTLC